MGLVDRPGFEEGIDGAGQELRPTEEPRRLLVREAGEMGGFEEAFLDRLLYARNRNWISPLQGMLERNEENMVVVGAAHLIGQDSVLDLLEQAGYEVERIQ